MNWDAFGAIAEMLGAIAVLITLLYLAAQTRQANLLSQSDSHNELIKRFDELNQLMVTDAALREALHKAEDHTQDELNQIYAFIICKCNLWITAENMHVAGRIDSDLYLSAKNDITVTIDEWPVTANAITEWRDRYPKVSGGEIFGDLK